MLPIDEKNKASEKPESLLFRLWGKHTQKKDIVVEEVTQVQPPPPVQIPIEKGSLQLLWEKWNEQQTNAAGFSPMEFVSEALGGIALEDATMEDIEEGNQLEQPHKKELLKFEEELKHEAEEILEHDEEEETSIALAKAAQLEAAALLENGGASPDNLQNAEAIDVEVPVPEPVDAQVRVKISKDKLKAWVFVFPPLNGGGEVLSATINEKLTENSVFYGIHTETIQKLCKDHLYLKMIEAASGEAAVDGKDGEVIDCFPRETKLEIKEDENGNVDYKSMNLIRNIKQGDVISTIVQPTEAIDGMDITGKKLIGRQGNPPHIQKSTGIELSEDGSVLVAALDGQLTYKDDKFVVEKILIIDGDVDSSTGNIDFNGDVTVQGDVREGFQLKAKGNVIVKGMVEDTIVISGGSIIIEKGMNGNGKGTLEAYGDIKCKFMENCTAYAGGSIYAGSVICSNIFCDGELSVTSGKGVIIGGSCTVHKVLEARVIGSKSNRNTTIVIGNTPSMLNKKMELETQLKNRQDEIEEINKDMTYLENGGHISRDRQAFMNQVKLKKPLLLMQAKQLEKQIEKLTEEMEDVSESRIKCGTIYPPTKLVIGQAKLVVEEVHSRCNIYYSEGEIKIGSQ